MILETMENHSCKELPEDCWELILNRLAIDDDGDLQSPSLVCKQFLSITDRLRHKLVAKSSYLCRNGCEGLFRALERFPNLKQLELCDLSGAADSYVVVDVIDWLFRQLATLPLDLQSLTLYHALKPPPAESFRILGSTMNNLKVLRCRFFSSCLGDGDLAAIANAFPWLEELDICDLVGDTITDAGIEIISRKLKGLRKIDITGNLGCSDRSLVALSSNCVFLNEIRCSECCITEVGILFVLRHSPNLTFLQAGYKSSPDSPLAFDNSKINARALRVLDLCAYGNQARLFCSVAEGGMPSLERLILHKDYVLNFHGLSTFLRACPSLKHLELSNINFLSDHSLRDLCRYLPNVVSVNLSFCSGLTVSAFFILAKECPRLSEVTLKMNHHKVQDDFVMDLTTNDQIKSLDFSFNSCLSDELLKKIGNVCPNLHALNVRGCDLLTEEGVCEFLKCCSQIKHLTGIKPGQKEILEEFRMLHTEI